MFNSMFRRIGVLAFSGLLFFGTVSASAQNGCMRRIQRAQMQLQQAVQRHGVNSRQAEKKRRELERAREGCHR
jgi:hypothetical protein